MRFRKRPEDFDAEPYLGVLIPGVHEAEDGRHYVMTAHAQIVYLEVGDWVVPEKNGRGYYPIKPDIFKTICDPI